jgi:glycosyltransferase involved in cell wall biosynthesis
MKLLVFAHIPPPHHGQSYMVKLMLDGLGGDCRKNGPHDGPVQCYHVNAQVSDNMEDIGSFRIGKLLTLLRFCLEAIWCRIRHGVRTFYYIPAPGKRAALYRDWIVMLMCRPFFRKFIHHWHAVGVGDWLRKDGRWFERIITRWLIGRPALGIALAIPSMRDALWALSDKVEIVPNGIPDPFPDFETSVLPGRRARLAERRALLAGQTGSAKFRVLYIAHCMREKGLFDAIDGVALANASLRGKNSPITIHLTVAGAFIHADEEREFKTRIEQPDIADSIEYAGFVGGEKKTALLRACDCLCFPTYYHAESFGLVVVEAMAAGMAVVTTRWRAIPEILPPDYPGYVPAKSPIAVSEALVMALAENATTMRGKFIERFTEIAHLSALKHVLVMGGATLR